MIYTDIPSVQAVAISIVYLLAFNSFPDMFKGMQRGIVKALGLQMMSIYVHLVCHWFIFMTCIYLFTFRWGYGLAGMFYAKICLEWSVVFLYTIILHFKDWDEISRKAEKRVENAN